MRITIRKVKAYPCAMRGRGKGWKQQIEIRNDGISNAITTAQKDSMCIAKVVKK